MRAKKVVGVQEDANGRDEYVRYNCPGCDSVATEDRRPTFHLIPYKRPKGGLTWEFNGDFKRPTLSPSVLSNVGGANPSEPICHHFVRDGQIQYLSDCTHALAGQTIELPEIEEATD